MDSAPQQIRVELESLLDNVSLAEEIGVRIAEAVGFDEDDQYKIGMSVRESIINAIEYGNKLQREKKVYLVFEFVPDRLVIRVVDQGKGFRLEDVPDPLTAENLLKVSGRGILMIQAFMDELDVRTAAIGGAELVMTKRFRSARCGSPADFG